MNGDAQRAHEFEADFKDQHGLGGDLSCYALFALEDSGDDMVGQCVVDPLSRNVQGNRCSGNGIGSHRVINLEQ